MALKVQKLQSEEHVMEAHDAQARKDTSVSFRLSSKELDLIKKAASKDGYIKYQSWLRAKLSECVAMTLGIENDQDD